MPPSNWLVFDRIREFLRANRVYQQERILQDQSAIDRITTGSEFIDFSTQSAILEQTNCQINRLERYRDYEQMDQMGEINLALDLASDECALIDPEHKHSLVIRANDKRIKMELEELFFDTLLVDRTIRPAVRYLCKFGDCPYEIVTDKNRTGVAAIKHMNVYNFTRIETRQGDLVGFFYQDDMLPEPIFLHPWACMHLRLLSLENVYHPYGRCCKLGTRVATPAGYKNIEDLKPGDIIYSFSNHKLIHTTVLASCRSGIKPIIRLSTRHFSIDCSRNHPVLTRCWIKRPFKFGDKWFADYNYKLAEDLMIGDELVIPKHSIESKPVPVPVIDGMELVNGRVTNQHIDLGSRWDTKRIDLPSYVDEPLAKLIGFLIGDGWLVQNNGTIRGVAFALGVDESINQSYEQILRGYGLSPTRRKSTNSHSGLPYDHSIIISSNFGNIIKSLGFYGRCTDKRLPSWIFAADRSIQEAMIDGIIDSDGSVFTDKWKCDRYQVELSNYELVKDIKMLLHLIGWKCGQIIQRKRSTDTTTIHGKEYGRQPSWLIYFFKSDLYKHAGGNGRFRGARTRAKECVNFGEDTIFEPIVSITDMGAHETADIQVDHPASNFVADGIVVHNSYIDGGRKSAKQLKLMEDGAIIYRITRCSEKRLFKIPVGLIPPKEVPEYLQQIARIFKRQRFYNPSTGTFDERYSPIIQEDDFYLPVRPDGSGPDVTTLPGAENLDQIADIEYFKKKMIAPTKIPFSRIGIGEGAGEPNEKSLSQSSAEFAKAVKWIQSEVALGLTKVALVHLALRGYTANDLKGFELSLAASSALEDLYRMETWQTRVGVMAELKDIGWFPKEWIVQRFTDLSPDEIEELKEMESDQTGGPLGGGPPGLGEIGGGEEMNDEAADDLESMDQGDLEDELGGDDEGDEDEQDLGGEPELEGYDYKREERLLLEVKNDEVKRRRIALMERWRNKYRQTSYLSFFKESKELDGLPKPRVDVKDGEVLVEGRDLPESEMLIEWSVPAAEREAAIQEVVQALGVDVADVAGISSEVTSADLPE